jgi:hypothetical protein
MYVHLGEFGASLPTFADASLAWRKSFQLFLVDATTPSRDSQTAELVGICNHAWA